MRLILSRLYSVHLEIKLGCLTGATTGTRISSLALTSHRCDQGLIPDVGM